MATNALPAGFALQEYRIEKVLGVGGFGLTYLALDGNLNLKVALKEFLPDDVATRGADHSIRPALAGQRRELRLGQAALPGRIAHRGVVPPPEHRARDALLRGQRHRLHGDGVRRGRRAPRLDQDPPAAERSAGDLAHRAAARRPAGGAQVGRPAPRYQARQHLRARGRHAGADRLRLGAPARHRAHRDRVARLRALRAVPHAGQPGPVERHLRARRRAVLAGDRRAAARSGGAHPRRHDAERPADRRPQPLPSRVPRRHRLGARAHRGAAPAIGGGMARGAVGRFSGNVRGTGQDAGTAEDRRSGPDPSGFRSVAAARTSRRSSPSTSARSPTWW